MLVDDFNHIGQLRFGAVALGERKTRQLTLENTNELGNARVKYEGYTMERDALKSVTLRVTFEPLPTDVGKEITVMLKFTVNDRFKLQCKATGIVTPRVPKLSSSWWKQRQEFYDENWMAKQTEGFKKWINYVLLDGTAQRLRESDAQDSGEKQAAGVKRRFDFSSLRVLAQKRLESKWAQAAVELYHSPSMDDILFNLQDEIGNHGLLFRADRPVYADVGLQEDLICLLNNYHPVWLCLGLYAVLGNQVMRQEKCSLRSIFSSTTTKYSCRAKKNSPSDRKMPRVLRRIILKHLVKDSHVAQNYRLVKNLLTPLDGSTADRNDGGNAFKNTKKNINGREYFDSLTQSFMLKFFMLVIFLDRAIEHKADKFAHFPCLFRIALSVKKTKAQNSNKGIQQSNKGDDDELWVKNSQVFVTEFCRLFLASEGRIDKHLKQLGYTLKHEQTALDEIDLEVKNLDTDLRDGVRLAKLMETLTTTPTSSPTEQGEDINSKRMGLSTFLRVPALSRLQKVHNIEICLHFLQDKCGTGILDNLKSGGVVEDKKHRLSGRVRVSSSGFAGLRSKVDEKMVENLAKDIVNGHREKTLALLWKLISSFQLQSLVNAQTMRREITNVIKRMSFRANDFFSHQQRNIPLNRTDEHECYWLLLEWCRAVCANYNVEVSDFSRSFADGKALCYLLHYYHPMLLSKSDLLPTTSDLRDEDDMEISESTLLANEQRHFAIINDRIKQLGEVPVLMPQQYNTKNPPEDKMVIETVVDESAYAIANASEEEC
ncbi:Abnormal spindle-like microcephaly-associated protein [Phytophthora palmivora]|uniref:Abnormal spindle-like microcephaly-associated protein n=1 Tax=Phytophthora palmivora TaxID=4796 RepID=A0A2P4Y7H2_9STRA|nr:Abnormal spindle-like microcephaly-associated protein [Phytophthora palmivora]